MDSHDIYQFQTKNYARKGSSSDLHSDDSDDIISLPRHKGKAGKALKRPRKDVCFSI